MAIASVPFETLSHRSNGRDPHGSGAVAVVAVHGVSDQTPSASARTITDLLLGLGARQNVYTPAHESPIRVPTRRVGESRDKPALARSRWWQIGKWCDDLFDDRSRYVRAQAEQGEADHPQTTTQSRPVTASVLEAPDYQFMRAQLVDYESTERPYETVRLETQRLGTDGTPKVHVHIYEMYWADLSRVGCGVLRALGAFYQLLFHASSLGRVTLDYAAIEHGCRGIWRTVSNLHKWAVRLLTVVIPVLSIVTLAVGTTLYTLSLQRSVRPVIAAVVPGALLAGAIAMRRYRRGTPKSFARASGTLLLVMALPAIAGFALLPLVESWLRPGASTVPGGLLPYLIALEWLTVAAVLSFLVFRAFDRQRPGVLRVGAVAYASAVICFVLLMFLRAHRHVGGTVVTAPFDTDASLRVSSVTLWVVQIVWATMVGSWIAFALLAISSWILGGMAVRRQRGRSDTSAEKRARRAVRTARLTLLIPAGAFLVTTAVVWSALIDASSRFVPHLPHRSLWGHIHEGGEIDDFLHDVLWRSTTIGLPIAVAVFVLGLLLVMWWFAPIAAAEARPPRHATEGLSRHMGEWLSKGGDYALGWLGAVVLIAAAIFATSFLLANLPLLASLELPVVGDSLERFAERYSDVLERLHMDANFMRGREFIEWVGRVTAAGTVGVLALRSGQLESASTGLRSVLDVMLDIDGYLREHPRQRTPRARLAERYVSLLRYLCAWRDSDGRPYDAIIIVAHSQGTVMTADTLGFVQRERDDGLAELYHDEPDANDRPKIRLFLFTMGSPLRQLYARFFPHLYSWVTQRPEIWRDVDLVRRENGDGRSDCDALRSTGLSANPDPAALQLTEWVNAYRSGDYVGRYLWRGRNACSLYQPAVRETAGPRVELCIGAGAHTHYWDARAIGEELDDIVARGAGIEQGQLAARS